MAFVTEDVGHNLKRSKATGTGAMAETLAPGVFFKLKAVRLHLNAAGGAGNFTATMDSASGAAYDANIITQDMTAVTDFESTTERLFSAGDELDFAWANAGSKTWGLEVFWSEF